MKLLDEINADLQKRIDKGIKTYGTTLDNADLNNLQLLNHELEHEQTHDYHKLLKEEIEFYKTKLYEYSEVYFHLINK
jgi:hypothetical protein